MKNYLLFICVIGVLQMGNAQVSGTVFRDFNGNGTKESAEPLVSGVIVNAYNSGVLCGTSTTTGVSSPNYSVAGCTGSVRVEFIIPSNGCEADDGVDYSALGGATYGSSVQFVDGASGVANFALYDPSEYGGNGSVIPDIYNITQIAGNPIPNPAAPLGDDTYSANLRSVTKTGYFEDGPAGNISTGGDPNNQVGHTTLALQKQTGTLWGTAYSKYAKKLFVSAFLRRHAGMGPLGPGGIYMIDPTNPNLSANLNFINIDALGFATHAASGAYNVKSNTARNLPAQSFLAPTYDIDAYDQVGKVSLGDMDLSEDGQFLFIVNLYDRKIYRIDLQNSANPVTPTAAEITSFSIPNPCSGGANAGEYRPFALKLYRGKLYAGVVCSGQDAGNNEVGNASSMSINIYEYSLGGTNTPSAPSLLYSQDLSYRNGTSLQTNPAGNSRLAAWTAWQNEFSPNVNTPMVTDIEFDNDGNILMALADRNSYQTGSNNYDISGVNVNANSKRYANGDILKLDKSNICGYTAASGSFLYGDFYDDNVRWHVQAPTYPAVHNEQSLGGIAIHRFGDRDEVVSSALNPIAAYSNGYVTFSNDDGTQQRANELTYDSSWDGGMPGAYAGKASGTGDIEMLSEVSPIEIGNRVWEDTDLDGIQDGDEPGIEGVIVQLYNSDGTTLIGEATTDTNGNYIFSNSPYGTTTSSFIYDISMLMPNNSYIVRVPNVQGVTKQTALGVNLLVIPDTGEGTDPDVNDSDGILSSDNAQITVMATSISKAGANNHTFDFGFGILVCPDLICLPVTVN